MKAALWVVESEILSGSGWRVRASAKTKALAIDAMKSLRRTERGGKFWRVIRIVASMGARAER